jgi:hypothetical protein
MKSYTDQLNDLYRERNQLTNTLVQMYKDYEPQHKISPLENRRLLIQVAIESLEAKITEKST